VARAADDSRIVKNTVIQIDLTGQARQIITLAFDFISMQVTVHDRDINTRLAQAQPKLGANDIPHEPLREFGVELQADVQVPHLTSVQRHQRLTPQATP
jgi:hypothetical protein